MNFPNHTSATRHCAGMDQLLERAPSARKDALRLRLTHLDKGRHLKLLPLWSMALPSLLDTWSASFDTVALLQQGIWPFTQYVDIDSTTQPLAAGQLAELRTAIQCGLVQPQGGVALGTQVSLYARRSAEHITDLTSHVGAQVASGRVRLIGKLVRPFGPPSERVVRALPGLLSGLELTPCAPPPGVVELGALPGAADRSVFEQQVAFALHDTDGNQVVATSVYLALAESCSQAHARAAGLPLDRLRNRRIRAVFKRAFMAGEVCVMRSQLCTSGAEQAVSSVVRFHAMTPEGEVDSRPAALARLESNSSAG